MMEKVLFFVLSPSILLQGSDAKLPWVAMVAGKHPATGWASSNNNKFARGYQLMTGRRA